QYSKEIQYRQLFMTLCIAAGEMALANGKNKADPRDRQITELKKDLIERDKVIGELTIANRILKKNGGQPRLTEEFRQELKDMAKQNAIVRITSILDALGIAHSSWYRKIMPDSQGKRPGPARKPIPAEIERIVICYAKLYPWYGYKKIAVICRRAGCQVKNRQAWRVMDEHDLLHKGHTSAVEIYRASKLYELLPKGPNELWQMDVTYIHIPGYGWWYAVTVIDYYSRCLLACYLTDSYSAANANYAIDLARAEAERIHGPLEKIPFLVTDNGPTLIAKKVSWTHQGFVFTGSYSVSHTYSTGIAGTLPPDPERRRGLLAAV
ncbi:MAG: DDE-type integrase/transposase/recombinase, partial [Desulfobacterales bacterium]